MSSREVTRRGRGRVPGERGIRNFRQWLPLIGPAARLARQMYNDAVRQAQQKPRPAEPVGPRSYSIYNARGGTKHVATKKRRRRRKTTLRKRVRNLEMKDPNAVRTYRSVGALQFSCSPNQCAYASAQLWTSTEKEAAFVSLDFMDRAATPAQDVISPTLTTLSNKILFKNTYLKCTMANNGAIPCNVTAYWVQTKVNTNDNPKQAMTEVDDEVGITDVDTNILVFPTDLPQFSRIYKILKTEKACLRAGDQMVSKYVKKNDKYDHLSHNQHGLSYDRGDIFCMLRCEGVLSHDKTNVTNVGSSEGTIDYEVYISTKMVYPSDFKFKTVTVNNAYQTVADPVVQGPNVIEIEETL